METPRFGVLRSRTLFWVGAARGTFNHGGVMRSDKAPHHPSREWPAVWPQYSPLGLDCMTARPASGGMACWVPLITSVPATNVGS
ncbi:hypothetical protein ACVIGA_007874 [Bradyrhizobium sp. USDA 3240]